MMMRYGRKQLRWFAIVGADAARHIAINGLPGYSSNCTYSPRPEDRYV